MDVQMLISLVKENPELYSTTHPNYPKIKLKEDIWEQIGVQLGTEGKYAKGQWRKLRDCHREALRRQKSIRSKNGYAAKPWTYQREMSFLLSYMRNRPEPSKVDICATSSTKKGRTPIRKKYGKCSIPKFVEKLETSVGSPDLSIEEVQLLQLDSDSSQFNNNTALPKSALSKPENVNDKDALHHFFMAMYCAAKALPMNYQRQIRNQIFNIVSQTEEQYEFDQVNNDPLNHMGT